MTAPITGELIAAGQYARIDFNADRADVAQRIAAQDELHERLRAWHKENTIAIARALARMRCSGYWRRADNRDTDRDFCEWIDGEIGISVSYAAEMLSAGRALEVLAENTREYFPTSAAQVRRLGSSWYLQHPESIVNVWASSVAAAGGQPSAELVAGRARAHKDDMSAGGGHASVVVHRRLAHVRRQLIELHRLDPGRSKSFLRELAESIPS